MEHYEELVIEIILFGDEDVITQSKEDEFEEIGQ